MQKRSECNQYLQVSFMSSGRSGWITKQCLHRRRSLEISHETDAIEKFTSNKITNEWTKINELMYLKNIFTLEWIFTLIWISIFLLYNNVNGIWDTLKGFMLYEFGRVHRSYKFWNKYWPAFNFTPFTRAQYIQKRNKIKKNIIIITHTQRFRTTEKFLLWFELSNNCRKWIYCSKYAVHLSNKYFIDKHFATPVPLLFIGNVILKVLLYIVINFFINLTLIMTVIR